MYSAWRNFRNTRDYLESFESDIEDIKSVTMKNFNATVCSFINKVLKEM